MMELGQELRMHFADMRSCWKSANDLRSKLPASVKVMLLFSIFTFVLGYATGAVYGLGEGRKDAEHFDAFLRMAETAQEAKGEFVLTERLRRTAVDRVVVDSFMEMQKPEWKRAVQNFIFTKVYPMRGTEAQELKFAHSIASQRLAHLVKPFPATLEEYRRRGMTDMIASFEDRYTSTATAYSFALGREVMASELLTDAELRAHLKSVDRQRAAAASR